MNEKSSTVSSKPASREAMSPPHSPPAAIRVFCSFLPSGVFTSPWPASLKTFASPRLARLALSRPSPAGQGAWGLSPPAVSSNSVLGCVSSRREEELSHCLWIRRPLKWLFHHDTEGMGRFSVGFQSRGCSSSLHLSVSSSFLECLLAPFPLFRGKTFSHRKKKNKCRL